MQDIKKQKITICSQCSTAPQSTVFEGHFCVVFIWPLSGHLHAPLCRPLVVVPIATYRRMASKPKILPVRAGEAKRSIVNHNCYVRTSQVRCARYVQHPAHKTAPAIAFQSYVVPTRITDKGRPHSNIASRTLARGFANVTVGMLDDEGQDTCIVDSTD